jgi:FAD/FMN-containing dehydrogenase
VKFTLLRSSGEVLECSQKSNAQYFAATVGGIGLTGLILQATLQLEKVAGPWIDTKTYAFSDSDEFFSISDDVDSQWTNSVAWIDCTSRGGGKGLLMAGNRSDDSTPAKYGNPLPFPITPPMSLVNPLTVKALNLGYYGMNRLKPSTHREHYEKFFYPLDSIDNWNRAYGSQGFYQYQSVIPMDTAQAATAEMLRVIKKSHQGSFLAVLKKFGRKKSLGMLSFPIHGATLALDFPNRRELTSQLFDSLDSIVKSAGGRLYLAKDARMSRELFESTYDNISTFTKYRDPAMSSDMSRRLLGK